MSKAVSKRYTSHIERIHKQIGIPANYAQQHNLQIKPEAKRLVYVGMEPRGRDHFLAPKAAKAWEQMKKKAKHDGCSIILLSGFRSVGRQQFLIEEKLVKGESLTQILSRLAAPGYSEHHTGRALDLAIPEDPNLDERFELTAAFKWLISNAKSFGFNLSYPRDNQHKIIYEPWHWLYEL